MFNFGKKVLLKWKQCSEKGKGKKRVNGSNRKTGYMTIKSCSVGEKKFMKKNNV